MSMKVSPTKLQHSPNRYCTRVILHLCHLWPSSSSPWSQRWAGCEDFRPAKVPILSFHVGEPLLSADYHHHHDNHQRTPDYDHEELQHALVKFLETKLIWYIMYTVQPKLVKSKNPDIQKRTYLFLPIIKMQLVLVLSSLLSTSCFPIPWHPPATSFHLLQLPAPLPPISLPPTFPPGPPQAFIGMEIIVLFSDGH